MKSNKDKGTLEYLGCDIESFKLHISEQFEQGMSWDNYGDWEIDHIVPIKYKNPTIEEVAERLHYTNTQPMWKSENLAKGNRFIGKLDPYESDFVKFEQKKSIVHPPSN
jgi:5-methylcytosine-specific restriction endonuclease McrA